METNGMILMAAGCLGAMVGSFLNVCIYRVPRGGSVWAPRSACPSCRQQIAWYDNIPVFSFLALRARCRQCHAPIGWVYPVVEVVTAIFFVACVSVFGSTIEGVAWLVLGSTLIALTMIDLEHQILPDVMTYPLAGVGAGLSLATGRLHPLHVVIGVLAAAGFLYGLGIVSLMILKQEGMGMGDVKLAGALGAWFGVKWVMVSLLMAFMIGGVVGIVLMATKMKERRQHVPFGPFMAAGAFLVMFASEWIDDHALAVFHLE